MTEATAVLRKNVVALNWHERVLMMESTKYWLGDHFEFIRNSVAIMSDGHGDTRRWIRHAWT